MTPQQQQEFNEMKSFIQSLRADSTIPLDVDRAFSSRLQVAPVQRSSKSPSDATLVVALTSVAKPPDGFVTITVNGNIRSVPYYN